MTVLVNKRFVFIRVIRGQKINAVVLTFLRRCRAVCTPLFLLSNRTVFPIFTVYFSLQVPVGFRIAARTFSNLYPAPRQQPLCSFSVPTQPPAIPLPYPCHTLGIPKRAVRVCQGYAYTMRKVCQCAELRLKWVDTASHHPGFRQPIDRHHLYSTVKVMYR